MKPLFLIAMILFSFINAFAQEVEMADKLRGSGKIYIVVAVLTIVLMGIFIFLFRIEKKVKKIEESLKER